MGLGLKEKKRKRERERANRKTQQRGGGKERKTRECGDLQATLERVLSAYAPKGEDEKA